MFIEIEVHILEKEWRHSARSASATCKVEVARSTLESSRIDLLDMLIPAALEKYDTLSELEKDGDALDPVPF